MNTEKTYALISDLIVLAKADDVVTDSEYEFILRIADRMGLSKRELDELFENPLPSKPLPSELERITHFYKLVLVMNVDQETHENELIMVRNFGLEMGIRAGAVDQILLRMAEYNNGVIPSPELIKIFQTYYN